MMEQVGMQCIDLPKELTDKLVTIALSTEIGQEMIKAYLLGKEIKDKKISIEGNLKIVLDD